MKNKPASLLLTTVLAVALAACGSSSQSSSSSEQASATVAAESKTVDAEEKTESETPAADSKTTDSAIKPELIDESKTEEKTDSTVTESKTTVSDADLADMTVNFEVKWDGGNESADITAVSNGKELWSRTTGSYPVSQLSTVTGIGRRDNAYYYIEKGSVVCLDLKTGNELWRNSDFGGSPAEAAYAWDENGNLLLSGYLGPDLFVCGSDGSTIKKVGSFDENYYWPYVLNYHEKDKALSIIYEMAPENESDTLYISVPDYTLANDSTAQTVSDDTLYYPDVNEYLSLRSEPNAAASVKRKILPGTAMKIIDTKKGWAQVIVTDTGETGYVNVEYISTVNKTGASDVNTEGDPFDKYNITDPAVYYPDVKEYLSLRTEPSTSASVKKKLYPGTAMVIIDSADGWAHVIVTHTGETGYVNMDYISTETNVTVENAYSASDVTEINTEGDPYGDIDVEDNTLYYPDVNEYLSLRSEPNTSASVKRKLYPGTAMRIVDTKKGWAEVIVTDTGETGYVNMDYISTVNKTGANDINTEGDPYGYLNYDVCYPDVDEYLSLRSEPNSSASVIRKVYPGTAMKIIDTKKGWANVIVTDTGETGYVNMDYIKY